MMGMTRVVSSVAKMAVQLAFWWVEKLADYLVDK